MKSNLFYALVLGFVIICFTNCGSPVGNEKAARSKDQAMPDQDTFANSKKNQQAMDSIAEAIWIKK